ncbi:MAG: hypothetical protein AB1345_10170 [Chloroflexota bacterium]
MASNTKILVRLAVDKPLPGSRRTLPVKALCSLNFNNLPSEFRITYAKTLAATCTWRLTPNMPHIQGVFDGFGRARHMP